MAAGLFSFYSVERAVGERLFYTFVILKRKTMLLFFDFGSGEIILIILVLFVVLGPKRLPDVARTLGKTINEMKRASAGFKDEINKEVQRLDKETRLSEFLQQKTLANNSPQASSEPVAVDDNPAPTTVSDPLPEDETGRVERKV
jgi:sec-independent protein translocase protein TatB